ncbi:GNAT family N-acetyltransferase [Victivallis sp. Marseille-Q1083]|mgnify:CR=1 FL=1|uniref:GNAT family N-acetyltransferase n=1 Tax=Victivallis sp. Marseille-Q1083 TaxID=2717288 RepID=UPI00158B3CD1|nr:GNAT family N-acetyltransferase [Victivallis sp. Marseille-Q1083]
MEKKLILQLASPPGEALWELYEALNWNRHVKQPAAGLELAHRQAFRTAAMYDGEKLVGVGRVVSDGVIAALLCGLGVHPGYRRRGIGRRLVGVLAAECAAAKLHLELLCEPELFDFYRRCGFEPFLAGMRLKI